MFSKKNYVLCSYIIYICRLKHKLRLNKFRSFRFYLLFKILGFLVDTMFIYILCTVVEAFFKILFVLSRNELLDGLDCHTTIIFQQSCCIFDQRVIYYYRFSQKYNWIRTTRTSPRRHGSDHRPLIYFSASRHVFFYLSVVRSTFIFFPRLVFPKRRKSISGLCAVGEQNEYATRASPVDLSLYTDLL